MAQIYKKNEKFCYAQLDMDKNEIPPKLDLRHHQELFVFKKGAKKLDPEIYEGTHFKVAKVAKWLKKTFKDDWIDAATLNPSDDL